MTLADNNPRAVPGGNQAPDYAREVTDRMAREYAEAVADLTKLLDEARELPASIDDDADLGRAAALVIKIRDKDRALEAWRVLEKQPYLRGAEGIDQFFFGQRERCARREKGGKAGAIDVLTARVKVYQDAKAARERQERIAEEERQRKIAEEARLAREAEELKAREAEAAAARARNQDKIEQHQQTAQTHRGTAEVARVEEDIARTNLNEAKVAAGAKTADLVRTRTDEGVLVTAAQEPYAEIVDASKLNGALLWAFVHDDAKLRALKAWAKISGHRQQMDGAAIGFRDRTVIR